MRKIGTLPSKEEAYRFSDFLYVQEIENTVELDHETVEIWVHDDGQLDAAKKHLDYFIANPVAPTFDAGSEAARKRAEEVKADARRKSRVVTREQMDLARNAMGFALIPMILGVLSVLATLFAGHVEFLPAKDEAAAARHQERFEMVSMTSIREFTEEDMPALIEHKDDAEALRRIATDTTLPEVRRGEVWRLITPIFVHFGILHIVFNMMWLRDLGGFFQHKFGPRYLVAFVVVAGILSNYGQLLMSGPFFGGMSGVNYGLFGFLWMRGKYDRRAGWQLNPMIVQTMLVWFIVCFVGLIPNVANTAHGVGLLVGMAWGYVSSLRSNGAL